MGSMLLGNAYSVVRLAHTLCRSGSVVGLPDAHILGKIAFAITSAAVNRIPG